MSKHTHFSIVYQEIRTAEEPGGINLPRQLATGKATVFCTDAVAVEIRRWRRWAAYAFGATDVVLHWRVFIASQEALDMRQLLDSQLTDAELQRIGIAKFEELLHNHPLWLGGD